MKRMPNYLFFGGIFGAALVGIVMVGVVGEPVLTEAFLGQNETNAVMHPTSQPYQLLSCEDIAEDIAAVDVTLAGGALLDRRTVSVAIGTASGPGDWAKMKKRDIVESDSVSFSAATPETVRFFFDEPLLRETLCRDETDKPYLTIHSDFVSKNMLQVYGSSDATAYRGPVYNCIQPTGMPCLGDVQDMAFALRAKVNSAPVIDPMPARKVNELETLSFTLHATDPDGDTITWGSSVLPENATLDPVTGEFAFMPTSDQIGGYDIVFTATDDGGPVVEATSITVTITVVDVETPQNNNDTLEEMVVSYQLMKAQEQQYMAHIKKIDGFIEDGRGAVAVQQLEALRKKLDQDLTQERLTEEQYAELANKVDEIAASLES